MARILLVGCGCRGRELAAALVRDGHVVRGTTRDPARAAELASAIGDAVVADPYRLATLTGHLDGVSAVCWLLGSAAGEAEAVAALHAPRLSAMLETLVDTHARGFVYEAAGSVDRGLLDQGAAIVRRAGETFAMPVEVVEHDPADHPGWTAAMAAAVLEVLSR